MTAPIPISAPGDPHSHSQPHPSLPIFSPPLPSTTPGSSISVSPQTPFTSTGQNNLGVSTTPTATTGGGMFKWASSLGKSPTNGNAIEPTKQRGFDIPHEDDHDEHDSFEFGDFTAKSWAGAGGGRRTMSMSLPSAAKSPTSSSPIAAILKGGFGETSPAGSAGQGHSLGTGVLADKAAKGQGVLRRLSLSGSGYRPAFLSPPLPSAPLPPSPPSSQNIPSIPGPAQAPAQAQAQAPGPPQAEPQINRAYTITGGPSAASRSRRFSEGTKKRGVSPMGERLLRDHGHF
ncbi:hypothetical protein I302_107660 [Kwoniella bestiolae CBS 10118]|uniref:Uncharacterized protein n=1 Tax=Kwoniella bestiolae CBS 10118 TaxID=1296100 RepID=A0A1B9FXW6_9TREE|nr:hypothetical protein I302_06601 [Kwoniella bestiolae CBS 10118]OCF23618.1 hypothetical protein I302_06601 [Kwoniella bestiolae CBS 10118]